MWYKNKVEGPGGKETIYVILDKNENAGFGLAVADVKQSVEHYHRVTNESYTLISGALEVMIGNDHRVFCSHVLSRPGQCIKIPLNLRHWARTLNNEPARILVVTTPPWSKDDHHIEK